MKNLLAPLLAAALLALSGCGKQHDPRPAQPQPKAVPVVGPVAAGPTSPRP